MSIAGSIVLFKLVVLGGLAAWLSLVVVNNILAFRNGAFAIGSIMNMLPFEQEPPIDTPLLARRVADPRWHRLIYALVLAIEVAVALSLLYAATGLAAAGLGWLNMGSAVVRANLALTGLMSMAFIFLLGGSWYAYYIRQEGLQTMHLVLIGVVHVALQVVNVTY